MAGREQAVAPGATCGSARVIAGWLVACACGGEASPAVEREVVDKEDAAGASAAETGPVGAPLAPDAAATGDDTEPPGETGSDARALAAAVLDPASGVVAAGDSLSRILSRAGVGDREVAAILLALRPLMSPDAIQPGQRFRIELDSGGALARFEFHRDTFAEVIVDRGADGQLRAREEKRATTRRELTLNGTIDSSLWAAVTAAGGRPGLVALLVDAFAFDIDFFTQTRAGDRFALVVEQTLVEGEPVGYGRVLAAEYEGSSAGLHRAFWWESKGGRASHYDERGRDLARTLLKTPLAFTRVSSEFNPRRMHPVLHRVKGHNGTDYAAPEGTPIRAAADGRITARGSKKGAGNTVILDHGGGLVTVYMHMSRFAEGQAVGGRVRQKQVIGYVGSTGLATGPHLHLGVKVDGRWVDAEKFEGKRGPPVPAGERAAFDRRVRELSAAMAGGVTPPREADRAEAPPAPG